MKKMITGALLTGAVMSMDSEDDDNNIQTIGPTPSSQTGGTGFIDCMKDTFWGNSTSAQPGNNNNQQ